MLLYLIGTVLLGLLTFVSLILLAIGLFKKKRNLWIGSLAGFVIGSVLTASCAFLYVRETYQYVTSDAFQNDTRKVAEHIGETVGSTVSGTAEGLEHTLDDEAIAKLAGKGARIAGKSVKAVAAGMDESMGKTTIFAEEAVEQSGIAVGRAELSGSEVKLFLAFQQDFKGKLVLTAYDSQGQKQDVSELDAQQTAGQAKVYTFPFAAIQPGLSTYCILTKE